MSLYHDPAIKSDKVFVISPSYITAKGSQDVCIVDLLLLLSILTVFTAYPKDCGWSIPFVQK